jgi:hypothetical protein
MIGRIPVSLAPEDNAMDAVVKVENGGVKDEKEGVEYIELNGTRYKKEDGKRARQSISRWMESATRRSS